MVFAPGSVPFGKLNKFGNIVFPGPSSPINVDITWITSPIPLIDAAFPLDPLGFKAAVLTQQKAVFQYGIVASCAQGGAFRQVESEWNTIYKGFRSHNNQAATLVVDTGDSDHDFAYCFARIDKFELKLQPGRNTNHYQVAIQFTLLSDWKSYDTTIHLTSNPDNSPILGDIRVPFGSLVSFANYSFTQETSVVQEHSLEWMTVYSSLPHSVFPVDHYGVNPCPLKPIDAMWEISFVGATYDDLYRQFNALLVILRSLPQHGVLVCNDAAGVPRQCNARVKSLPVTLSAPLNSRVYFAKITFELLSDWSPS